MKLLLDTLVVLWWGDDPNLLSEAAYDPFDRLLVAQTIGLGATLVARGKKQQRYEVCFLKV